MMDSRDKDPNEAQPVTKTREDSSALYSWANLHGIKHRDFSARHRAGSPGEDQQMVVPAAAMAGYPGLSNAVGSRPSRDIDNVPRTDGVERRRGVRRAQAAASAEAKTRNAPREITDPDQRQAARDAGFDLRRRSAAQLIADDDSAEANLLNEICPETDLLYDVTTSESLPPSSVVPGTADSAGPAWLYSPPTLQIPAKPLASASGAAPVSVAETLQSSRERVASRWFALKGVFEQTEDPAEAASLRQKETRTPVLAVYSLAGGVGKTSLVATVGRSLSAMGEKVLLTDTTSHGLLPFYFGANELQHDTVRTFSPPSGSTDAPISLVSYEMEEKGREQGARELLLEEIVTNSQGMHRILLDLSTSAGWMIRQMARMNLTVLVPLAPDMNSVIGMGHVEKFFSGLAGSDARPLQPFYLLNQFDPSLPLHLDVREVLRRKLGDRLLPFVVRRAPAVSEALAEGMTVVDYAPDTPIAEDYVSIATWLRTIAAPAAAGFRNVRWTER